MTSFQRRPLCSPFRAGRIPPLSSFSPRAGASAQARAETPCRDRRSWTARGIGRRGEAGRPSRALAGRSPPHLALDRSEAEERLAGESAHGALSPSLRGSRQHRRIAYPHRPYARRSGRDRPDAPSSRQRSRRPCRHGARGRTLAGSDIVSSVCSTCRKRGLSRRCARPKFPLPTIPPTAIRVSPACGCAELLPALVERGTGRRAAGVAGAPIATCGGGVGSDGRRGSRAVAREPGRPSTRSRLQTRHFGALPAEVALRLLGRAVTFGRQRGAGGAGQARGAARRDNRKKAQQTARFRRTLAGAMVTVTPEGLTVERAPPRRMP